MKETPRQLMSVAFVGLLIGATVAVAPVETAAAGTASQPIGDTDEAVEYVRSVEEIKGHLEASLVLKQNGNSEQATHHAGHPTDAKYNDVLLPPLRDADSELASKLEQKLDQTKQKASELTAAEYETYLREDLFPVLDEAVAATVSEQTRSTETFATRVNVALLERIDDEYAAAVTDEGTRKLDGEYWDGRGFLVRIETRNEQATAGFDSAVATEISEKLSTLRDQYEKQVRPAELKRTTLALRIRYAAGAGFDDAVIEDETEAVRFVRNVEEIKGHLESSAILKQTGDAAHGTFHAGHPGSAQYFEPLGPAVYRADATLWNDLTATLEGLQSKSEGMSAEEYETYLRETVFPMLDEATTRAVDEQYRTGLQFHARVNNALLERIDDEYSAAVTDEGTRELKGEYWDGKGFLVRIEKRHDSAIANELKMATERPIGQLLEELRSEYEATKPPATILDTTMSTRVRYAAAANVDQATIDDETEAVRYMRNVEEMKGHLESSAILKRNDDTSHAAFHTSHPGGAQYIDVIGPALLRADEDAYNELRATLGETSENAHDQSAAEFDSYLQEEVFPTITAASEQSVPQQYRDDPAVNRKVAIALVDRLEEEYSAAITEEGEQKLKGEYWDGRGFLVRISELHQAQKAQLTDESNEAITSALETLRKDYEAQVSPSELEPSAAALETALEEAETKDGGMMGSSDSENQGSENDPADAATNANETPGFGIVAVLCALLGGALLARRSR